MGDRRVVGGSFLVAVKHSSCFWLLFGLSHVRHQDDALAVESSVRPFALLYGNLRAAVLVLETLCCHQDDALAVESSVRPFALLYGNLGAAVLLLVTLCCLS